MRLAGKTAIVTGSGAGIGRAIAERFAQEGAKVVVSDVEDANGQETVAMIKAAGGEAIYVHCDVSNDEEAIALGQAAVDAFGVVDILINNAAAFVFCDIDSVTKADWDRVLGVNVRGPANCVKGALPGLRKAGGGSIVNIASVSGYIAQPKFVTYNTSKGAVLNMTRCLAMDLAPENIRVNTICPGAIRTRATDNHIAKMKMDPVAAYREFADGAVMKRMGEPKEIASAALFLASEDASYVTGATLVVDGGQTID